jgi:hypothetical protein
MIFWAAMQCSSLAVTIVSEEENITSIFRIEE